ncbi:MAG: hypothetical protein SF051_05395 [Elusimicrobiota bacterium]|nr:hypothetical protein [Elusimicrobiota bacterium]
MGTIKLRAAIDAESRRRLLSFRRSLELAESSRKPVQGRDRRPEVSR